MKTASKVYTALIFIFLYAPIIVLIIFSFNDTDTASRTQFSGFTLRWYQRLFEDRYILEALLNTLIIAVVSAFASTVLGTMAAVGINRMKRMRLGIGGKQHRWGIEQNVVKAFVRPRRQKQLFQLFAVQKALRVRGRRGKAERNAVFFRKNKRRLRVFLCLQILPDPVFSRRAQAENFVQCRFS